MPGSPGAGVGVSGSGQGTWRQDRKGGVCVCKTREPERPGGPRSDSEMEIGRGPCPEPQPGFYMKS